MGHLELAELSLDSNQTASVQDDLTLAEMSTQLGDLILAKPPIG